MANYSCSSCDDLRTSAPNFVVNGITDTECTSLKNNTGLNPSSGHSDCTDLDDINDCLVGNMAEEAEAYDICDWKEYIKKFVPNVWTTIKAIICAICGLWTLAEKVDCIIDYITKGKSFSFGEYTSTGNSCIVAGKGVSFANVSQSGTANDITITYVAGGMSYLTGSCLFYKSNFTDAQAVANFDHGGTSPQTSSSRLGNTKWNQTGYLGAGGELVYELRIKKSEYPQISRFWNGVGNAGAGGVYDFMVVYRNEGSYAPGQHGWCNSETGAAEGSGSDNGHKVPAGWMYLQVRMKNLDSFGAIDPGDSGGQYTPVCLVPIRINQDQIGC